MSGQSKNYKMIEKQINEYVRTHNIYGPHEPCDVNLHALGKYIEENNLSNTDVTPEIVEMFKRK